MENILLRGGDAAAFPRYRVAFVASVAQTRKEVASLQATLATSMSELTFTVRQHIDNADQARQLPGGVSEAAQRGGGPWRSWCSP